MEQNITLKEIQLSQAYAELSPDEKEIIDSRWSSIGFQRSVTITNLRSWVKAQESMNSKCNCSHSDSHNYLIHNDLIHNALNDNMIYDHDYNHIDDNGHDDDSGHEDAPHDDGDHEDVPHDDGGHEDTPHDDGGHEDTPHDDLHADGYQDAHVDEDLPYHFDSHFDGYGDWHEDGGGHADIHGDGDEWADYGGHSDADHNDYYYDESWKPPYNPQIYPGNTLVAKNRKRHMLDIVEKLRDISDVDITAILGHRSPGSDYPSTHPPLVEINEPDCPIREIVQPTLGAAAGDRVRYVQFADSMYNAPATPYWRSYHAAINFRGVDPGTLSGRQIVEMRERDLEVYAKSVSETEITDWGLSGMRGCTVHGHSLRLQEDGTMFDMLDRRRLEGGVIVMDKDQVGVPIDRKVNLGKPMSELEAAKRTTIFRVDNVPFRNDKEVIEHVQRIWELRTKYGYQPK